MDFTLQYAVNELYPNAIPNVDFFIFSDCDTDEQYIGVWNLEVPQPTNEEIQAAWQSFLVKQQDIQNQAAKDSEIEDLKKYLRETDFYYIRQLETQKVIPLDIKQRRIAARQRLNDLGL